MAVLGLDISKAKIHAALRTDEGKVRRKAIPNSPAGFRDLLTWAQRYTTGALHACLEATGTYGDGIAVFLHDAGCAVSIVNPAAMRAYAASQLSRTKTDDEDAALIAHFAATQQPPVWTPPAPELRVLQALVRRLDALIENLEAQIAHVRQLIRDHIDRHPDLRQQRDLLTTIPGIGEATAATLIAELFDKPYTSARQAAAFAGLVPRLRQSGQWRGRTRLSKIGPSRLRKALFFPALTALRCNPTIRASAAPLRAAGRPKMVIVGAAMRRLIHLAFGVLKTGRAYEAQPLHP